MKKLFIAGFMSLCHFAAGQELTGPDFPTLQYIGDLKPRTTYEISGSDLWIGGEVLDRDYADYHSYKHYLDSLGAKKIRLQSGWAKTEKVKGKYDFAWLDSIVDDALARRIEPWIQISYGNELYPGAGGISLGEGLPVSDEAYVAWLNYTEALVEHFKDRVDIWEIWNEADHRYNDGGPELYARLYYETAKKVREVQPRATLVGLSMAGVSRVEYADFFFNYLKERDALHLVDAITFHGYPKNPDEGFDAVNRLQEVAYKYRPGIELWQGESGCPSTLGSSGALSGHPWTELTQAKWNLRRALAHVGRGYPFSLFTISEYNYNRKKFQGLNTKGILKINDDLSIAYAKPAYHAYQNLTSLLDHRMERLPLLPFHTECDSSLSVFAFRHKVSHAPMIFTWIDSSIPSDNNQLTKADFNFSGIRFSDPVMVDLLSGKIFELPDEMIEISNAQVQFSGIPVYDSPVVIIDKELIHVGLNE